MVFETEGFDFLVTLLLGAVAEPDAEVAFGFPGLAVYLSERNLLFAGAVIRGTGNGERGGLIEICDG